MLLCVLVCELDAFRCNCHIALQKLQYVVHLHAQIFQIWAKVVFNSCRLTYREQKCLQMHRYTIKCQFLTLLKLLDFARSINLTLRVLWALWDVVFFFELVAVLGRVEGHIILVARGRVWSKTVVLEFGVWINITLLLWVRLKDFSDLVFLIEKMSLEEACNPGENTTGRIATE